MAKEISTQILIQASPAQVWNVLTDFANYPTWNPFIRSLQGEMKVGNTITVTIQPPNRSTSIFKPTLLAYQKDKELRWLGSLPIPGLFKGEHIFQLQDQGNGSTLLVHKERFRGLLVPLLKNMLEGDTKKGFELMNEKVKERAEA